MVLFYENCKMHVLFMNVALFARPLHVNNSICAQFRADIDETRAIGAVKCKPAKRIKTFS